MPSFPSLVLTLRNAFLAAGTAHDGIFLMTPLHVPGIHAGPCNARRFGVEVPNLTSWRRATTGDLVSAFDFANRPRAGRVHLPDPRPRIDAAIAQCGPNIALGTATMGAPFPVPPNRMPQQQPGSRRAPRSTGT